ncbi:MAG: CDC27 family protein [Planctomycetes bacterium]|nr:CDC27 family protein [Planctomycetota bacterium]
MAKTLPTLFALASGVILLFAVQTTSAGGKFPPPPRPLPQLEPECAPLSMPEFDRVLKKLKDERASMGAEWKDLAKGSKKPVVSVSESDDVLLELLLKRTLQRLQEREKPSAPPTVDPIIDKGPETAPNESKKKDDPWKANGSDDPSGDSAATVADPLAVAHALLRAEKYQAALASFREIDLKEKKAEDRVPIQILMASCLLRLGKHDEAIDLLREAANSRADERTAGYARWQLETQLWNKDVTSKLNEVRQRRLALEKRR